MTLKLDDGSTYPLKGKLQFTDVTVDPATGAVQLRAIFPNPDGCCCPACMCAPPSIEGVDPHGILVPQQAVGHDQKGEPTALVVDDKNSRGCACSRPAAPSAATGWCWTASSPATS